MKITLILFLLILSTSAHAAAPACTVPNTYPCAAQAVNPQPTDILTGTQGQGPQRVNQTVKYSISQILSGMFDAVFGSAVIGTPTGGNQGAGTVNAQGLFVNGVPVTTTTLPTGATTARTPSAVASDTVNPLFFGPGGVPVDITGVADAQPAINAAIVQACATNAIRTKSVHVPPGKYLFNTLITLPANCSNLTIEGDPGTVIFIASLTNINSNGNVPVLMTWGTGNDRITIKGIIFDGNTLGGATNSNGLVRVNGAARDPAFIKCEFRHSAGNGMWIVSELHITAGTLSAEAQYLDTQLNFNGTLPSSVHMGAYILAQTTPGYYITGLTSNQITVQKPLDDTQFINSRVQVTPAFTVGSPGALAGSSVIPTADTSGLKVAETLFHDTVKCIVPGTRILSIQTNVSVTTDTPLQCPIAPGANIAAIMGIPNLLIQESKFLDLAQQLRNGQITTYTTATSATCSSGSPCTSLVFNCFSASGCTRVGPIPGNFTASTGMPAGMPASNPVAAQLAVNFTQNTFTISFKNPITANIPTGTPIPFTVGVNTGKGYAVWAAAGEYWSTPGYRFLHNVYQDTWATPLFIANTLGTLEDGDIYYMNYNLFESASSVAPSGCSGGITTVGQRIQNVFCYGSNGAGMEYDHTVDGTIHGNYIEGAKFDAIGVSGGRNLKITDNTTVNSGQYVNHPIVWVPPKTGSTGLQLSGSVTAGRIGQLDGLIVNDFAAVDSQVTHTQNYGISSSNHNSLILNPNYGLLNLQGNLILATDPVLNINPPGPGESNFVVNPCMTFDQRNEGGIVATSHAYATDQWDTLSAPNTVHYQRTATAQGGCPNSLKMFVNTTATPSPTDLNYIDQGFEIGNVSNLRYGTNSPVTTIVDFCAKTTTAGTYGWGIQSHFPAVSLRAYASSFTTTGTTSQCFSFVVPGDTVAGFAGNINNLALTLSFDSGSGSNFYTATCNSWQTITANTNNFCSTGVSQLSTLAPGQAIEISAVRFYPGTTDAPWVNLGAAPAPYTIGRYYSKTFPLGTVPAQNAGTSGALCSSYDNMVLSFPLNPGFNWNYPQEMRAVPTVTLYNPSAANANWRDTTANADIVATNNVDGSQDIDQVLIGAAPVVPSNDNLCIHATANASF
jgi:hypothetical protein